MALAAILPTVTKNVGSEVSQEITPAQVDNIVRWQKEIACFVLLMLKGVVSPNLRFAHPSMIQFAVVMTRRTVPHVVPLQRE